MRILQTLPALQGWVRDLQTTAGLNEAQNLIGHIEQWAQQAQEELGDDQLTGTLPILLTDAAIELFNLSVCKGDAFSDSTKAKVRSAACSLLNLPSDNENRHNDTWLRIHYFTAAAWHDAKIFEQAEIYLQIACDSRLLVTNSRELPAEIREIAFNIYSLRSDNFWAMNREPEAKLMALKALKNLDLSAAVWLHLKLYNKGVKLYQSSSMDKAAEWLKMSLEALSNETSHSNIADKRCRTLRALSLALKASNKLDEALQAINHSLESGSNDVDSLYLKTELLIRLEEYDDASDCLLQTVRHSCCGQKMGMALCHLFKEAGQPMKSIPGYNEMLVKFPQSTKLKISKLRCLLAADDIEAGAHVADQVISDHLTSRRELDDEETEEFRNVLNNVALHFFEIRMFHSCSEWIARSERLAMCRSGDNKSIYLCRCALSIAEIEQGNTNEALQCALKADSLCPQLSLAKLVAAHCYISLNDPESATQCLRDAFSCQEFDRKYLSIVLSQSIKAEFTECAALCIEELLSSESDSFDQVGFLQCAIDLQYKFACSASESLECADMQQALNRLFQHLRSAAQLIQGQHVEASANPSLLVDVKKLAVWFGKIAWNAGILCSKNKLMIGCSDFFHLSAGFCQTTLGANDGDIYNRMLISLCMSVSAAMQHLSESQKSAKNSSIDSENLCNFCQSRIREFHAAAKSTPGNPLLNNLYPIIHILELQVKLILGDPNIDIHVKNAANIPGWKPSLFEEIASICLMPPFLRRDVAVSALQYLLSMELGQAQHQAATINIEHVSKVIRKLITLSDNIDKQLPFFEQARSVILSIASSAALYPRLEAQWLLSRSWNNGVIAYRAGRWESAEMWMSKSIQLSSMFGDICSTNKDEMVRSHAFVLSRLQQISRAAKKDTARSNTN